MVYVVGSVGYKFYLQLSDGSLYYPDYITRLVGLQCEALLNSFGYQVQLLPHPDEPSLKLIINGVYLARIVEGCNALSVIILFLSFIVAFASNLKTTLFYMLSGSVLIYAINILRIVLLVMASYHYPEYDKILHGVVFPLIIYGFMFLLWVFWVNRFANLKKANE